MGSLRVQRARAEAPRDPLPGTVINDKFRVGALLARGGMGRIYRAEQVPLGRPVALKVLRSHVGDDAPADPNFQKRFFLEASILSKLQHTNIVTLFDYGRIEGLVPEQYFMAMEFLAGETLSARIRSRGALSPAEALGVFRQIARGLREAHRHGVVHRDLKPENMMLVPGDDGEDLVKIVDFGIGKLVNGDFEELTQEGVFVGSPKYMAPEQILSDSKIDERTDVYSFGVIMFECLSGKLPFEGDTSVKMMMAHCGCPVPSIASRNPAARVPPALEDVVRHALEKEPANRPSGMEALMGELRACEEVVFDAHSRSSPPPRALPRERGGSVPPPASDSRRSTTPAVASLEPVASRTSRPPAPSPSGARVGRLLAAVVGFAAACGGTAAMFVVPYLQIRARAAAEVLASAPSPPIAPRDPILPLLFTSLPPVRDRMLDSDATTADAAPSPVTAPTVSSSVSSSSSRAPAPSSSSPSAPSAAGDTPRPAQRGATSVPRPAAAHPAGPSVASPPPAIPEIKTTR
jgi:serine/threonine protein kinase